jgi:hypothetical protein
MRYPFCNGLKNLFTNARAFFVDGFQKLHHRMDVNNYVNGLCGRLKASFGRSATFVLVMAFPLWLVSMMALTSISGFSRNQALIANTVAFHSGTERCKRPLPRRCTQAQHHRAPQPPPSPQ